MDLPKISVLILVLILMAIYVSYVYSGRVRPTGGLSKRSAIVFGLILAGFIFGKEHPWGYALVWAGLLLSVFNIIVKLRNPRHPDQE